MLKQYEVAFILAGLFIACASLFIAGYHIGTEHVQLQFDSYKKQQIILAQEQEIKAKQQEIENANRATAVSNAYENDLAKLRNALRMRDQASHTAAVSAVASCTASANGTGTAPSGIATNPEFIERAMKTELMLESWQDWAKKNKFPIQ